MVQDKELLLKDLCARLPYGVKVESVFINPDSKEHKSCRIEVFDATSILMIRDGLGEFKPYLFPLSSMAEKQKKELRRMNAIVGVHNDIFFATCDEYGHDISITHEDAIRITRWLNENHFDYNGLIEKGLAIDATGLNIY